jgi:hypothetical protein
MRAPGEPLCLNTTPGWLAPNGLCQDNLEVGDVIENLPNARPFIYPVLEQALAAAARRRER